MAPLHSICRLISCRPVWIHLFCAVVFMLECVVPAFAVKFRLKSGEVLEGRLISSTSSELVVESGGAVMRLPISRLAPPSEQELNGQLACARQAMQTRAFDQATSICLEVLSWQPDHPPAKALLDEIRAQCGLVARQSSAAARVASARERMLQQLFEQLTRFKTHDAALGRLWEMPLTPNDLPLLHRNIVKHPHSRARRELMFLLIPHRSPSSVDPLIEALQMDSHPRNRESAAYVLGVFKAGKAENALIQTMRNDPEWDVRYHAADALNKIGTPTALDAIRKAIAHERHATTLRHLQFLAANPRFRRTADPVLRPGAVLTGYYQGTKYQLYLPAGFDPARRYPLLVSVHGTDGYSEMYIDIPKALADEKGVVVLAPNFDRGMFYNMFAFNLNMAGWRPDLRLLEIVDHVSSLIRLEERFYIFGHSEGGMFVNRFILAHPERIKRAAYCAGSSFVTNNPQLDFPFGIRLNPAFPDLKVIDFKALALIPSALVIGLKDEPHRVSATRGCYQEIRDFAQKNQLPCHAEYYEIPEGIHSGYANWPKAAEFLFRDLASSGSK